jgi:cysteinyl-tRNA synthetase
LSAHYRGPIQFETEKLADGRVAFPGVDEAERRADHAYAAVRRLEALAQGQPAPAKFPPELAAPRQVVERAVTQAEAALDDDLNTPVALAVLSELTKLAHELADLASKRRKDAAFGAAAGVVAAELLTAIRRIAAQLGMLQATPADYAARTRERRLRLRKLTPAAIDQKVAERAAARAGKDFARGDALRGELAALGIALHDGADGTTWNIEQ